MAKFLTELDARLISDEIWELDESLIYKSDLLKFPLEAPKGFQTDFASVPRIPIIFMFFGDRAHREAVIHDYCYRIDSGISKSLADDIFFEAMTVRNKSWYIRYPMKWGVCIGGGSSYHKRRVRDKLC